MSRKIPPLTATYSGGGGAGSRLVIRRTCRSPIEPSATRSRTDLWPGSKRRLKPIMNGTPAASTGRECAVDLLEVEADRLLAEDRLACHGRRDDQVDVGVGAGADRHGVDVVGGQQLLDRPAPVRRSWRRRPGRLPVRRPPPRPRRSPAPPGPAVRRASGRSGRSRARRSGGPAAPGRCRRRSPRPLARTIRSQAHPLSGLVRGRPSRRGRSRRPRHRPGSASSAASPEIARTKLRASTTLVSS